MRQNVGGLTCWSSVISELKSYSSCVDPSSATVRDMLTLLYSDTFCEEREREEKGRKGEGERGREREREGGSEGEKEREGVRERKKERDNTCININTVHITTLSPANILLLSLSLLDTSSSKSTNSTFKTHTQLHAQS